MFPAYLYLLPETDGDVATLTLNRPEAANALNKAMALEIKDFFKHLDQKQRAVILTGSGIRAFCAGADLKERSGMDKKAWHAQHEALEGAVKAILKCKMPVIAAVNGAAFGGGLELALACDFIYASSSARFGLTETSLGIIPGMGGTQSLSRAIGTRKARELIYTARSFTAQEAYAMGMLNKLCEPENLVKEAKACAHAIAASAPMAVHAAKHAITKGAHLPLGKAMKVELKYYESLLESRDRHEGINAFNEKRKPKFTGE